MTCKLNWLYIALITGLITALSACGIISDNEGYPLKVGMKCNADTVTVWGNDFCDQIEICDSKGNWLIYEQYENDSVKVTYDWLTVIHPIKKQPSGKYKVIFISAPNNQNRIRTFRIHLNMSPKQAVILLSQQQKSE